MTLQFRIASHYLGKVQWVQWVTKQTSHNLLDSKRKRKRRNILRSRMSRKKRRQLKTIYCAREIEKERGGKSEGETMKHTHTPSEHSEQFTLPPDNFTPCEFFTRSAWIAHQGAREIDILEWWTRLALSIVILIIIGNVNKIEPGLVIDDIISLYLTFNQYPYKKLPSMDKVW